MPQGMTGFGRGSASVNDSGVTSQVTVEVKSVNNRFLKVATRLPDLLSEMESEIESQVRGKLSRGSVYCLVQLEHPGADGRFQLNTDLLRDWHPRLVELARDLKTEAPSLASMLAMDGVVNELRDSGEATDALKAAVLKALGDALAGLLEMRLREGAAGGAGVPRQAEGAHRKAAGGQRGRRGRRCAGPRSGALFGPL